MFAIVELRATDLEYGIRSVTPGAWALFSVSVIVLILGGLIMFFRRRKAASTAWPSHTRPRTA